MDNLRAILEILFRHTSSDEVLHMEISCNRTQDDHFLMLANAYIPRYSNDEIKNMFAHLSNEFEWHNNRVKGEEYHTGKGTMDVFDAIFVLSDIMLIEEDGYPLCRYEHLLRWREVILTLDEDLFTTAFLAYHDLLRERDKRDFFWRVVIGHNNRSLNQLLKKGLAENHFHLNGSAPMFHLSWINLMNHVNLGSFLKALKSYDKRRLNLSPSYSVGCPRSSLLLSYYQAVLIRLFLYCKLRHIDFVPWPAWGNGSSGLNSEDEYRKLIRVLKNAQDIEDYLHEIQNFIDDLKKNKKFCSVDYTICKSWLAVNPNQHLNENIVGERWFLYEVFKKIYAKESNFMRYGNMFYMYIIIKSNIRAELIQTNHNVGFDNFLLYQNRKEAFIEGTDLERIYVRMAVRDTILSQSISLLEARITPKKTAVEIKNSIEKYDNWVTVLGDKKEKELLKNYFYVFHFVKGPEIDVETVNIINYRHLKKREEVKTQAIAIAEFRERYEMEAKRVKGIDACSPEIGCRPEVFGQAFRFLRDHSVYKRMDVLEQHVILPSLRTSYHVGEDFLDIIDGLRAIDEAVSFLNLRCGDRLGHALALGVDVTEWYASKSERILISQHDYLDNLVWLYSKIRKFHIEGCEDALRYIEKRYDEYFRIVYLNCMPAKYFSQIAEVAAKYFKAKGIPNHYYQTQGNFCISTYYDSWKLRGDNPLNYKDGFFKPRKMIRDSWERYDVNIDFPDNYMIRYNSEAAYLYHLYHYCTEVRNEGKKTIEVKLNSALIKAADKVQRKLQQFISSKGIAIETNPSSNYLIGSFKRYDKHPIMRWYNLGLTTESHKLQNSPQIQVSINTDDQGVFATCLENEYALLALALEKVRDENGLAIYNRTMIYDWLDRIREMGLSMNFQGIHELL